MADPTTTIEANKLSSTNATLSYPGDIQSMSMYTRITFVKYNRARPSSTRQDTTTATIILPLPDSFGDTRSVDWGQEELNQYGGIADKMSDWATAVQSGNSLWDTIKADATGAKIDSLRAAGVLAMTLSPKNMRDSVIGRVVGQNLGAVVNPHLSLMFQGVPLRNHHLEWRFSPHNEKEAKELGNILKKIRSVISPSYNANLNKFALDYPDTCSVEFQGVDANYKTKIFKSAVTGFNTNLAPSGLTFYPNGTPVEIGMSLSLMETEIVVRSDFE